MRVPCFQCQSPVTVARAQETCACGAPVWQTIVFALHQYRSNAEPDERLAAELSTSDLDTLKIAAEAIVRAMGPCEAEDVQRQIERSLLPDDMAEMEQQGVLAFNLLLSDAIERRLSEPTCRAGWAREVIRG